MNGFVAVRPLCEALGILPHGQVEKLKSKAWATTQLVYATGADGKNREMFCINKDAVPMWLATIDENRVKEESRERLVAYQKEAAKALNDYFTEGVAVNERVIPNAKELRERVSLLKALKSEVPAHSYQRALSLLVQDVGIPGLDGW